MQRGRIVAALVIAAGASLAAWGAVTLPLASDIFGRLEQRTREYRIRNQVDLKALAPEEMNPTALNSPVSLVLFDSASVQDWPYLTPFPRAMLADLVDVVSGMGARAIGLDVYLDRRYPRLAQIDNGDARLRAAIERAGNVVLVAPTEERDGGRVLLPPDPYFADVAAGVASADLPTSYETVTEAYLTVTTADGVVPSFSLALYAEAAGIDLDSLLDRAERTGRLDVERLPGRYARVDGAVQRIPIRFLGPPSIPGRNDGAFTAASSADLLLAKELGFEVVPSEWFRDKVVILGSGFHDSERFRTPFYDERRPDGSGTFGWTYGPEIHANAAENLLTGSYVVPPGPWLIVLLLAFSTLAVAGLTFRKGAGLGGVAAASLALGTVGVAFVAFDRASVMLPMVAPTLAIAFAYLGSTGYVSIVEGREKRMIRGAFGKFVSPEVVSELVADPSRLKLGGEKRPISILFSDLAGFTSLSESMEPERLVAILNDYLDEMAEIVLHERGTLDKYIGDAIMALYGAPTAFDDHALRACRTALAMQRRLEGLNDEWRSLGLPYLRMRIGINTGSPVVGNIGGEKRFDYTALGDAVNLAARLEPACKTYGISIMIAQNTREQAGDAVVVREMDRLAVYGKSEPVAVYELVGMAGELLGDRAEVLRLYDAGLSAYRDRDFELALRYFEAALETDPEDGPSAMYAGRCRDYIAEPPPLDWDFVERRQVK